MRSRPIKIAFAVVVLVAALSGAAAASSWTGYTQAVGVDASGHVQTGATTALGADIAHQTGSSVPVVYAGDAQHVSQSGAAVLRRSASTYGDHNLTLIGAQTGLAASYYSGVKNAQGDYVYSVRSLNAPHLAALSESAVTKHYTAASTAVVANPQYVSDYAGGIANATQSGTPLLYVSSKGQYAGLNATLHQLGVQHVDYTKHVPSTVQTNLTADYSQTTALATGTGASYINSQVASNGTGTLYVVNSVATVPYVEQAAGASNILVLPASGGVGSTINSYLQAHHPKVEAVGNPDTISSSMLSAMRSNTTRSVNRVGYGSQQGLSTRLALLQENSTNPLVAVSGPQSTTQSTNGSVTVSAVVRNYGFTGAKNVEVTLAKNKTASYNFSVAPTTQNATQATWKLSALPANGTHTLTYSITGVSGSVQTLPEVTTYSNAAGTSFHGAAFFSLASWIQPVRAQALGLVQSITSHIPHVGGLSPLLVGGLVAVLIGLALVVYYLNRNSQGGL